MRVHQLCGVLTFWCLPWSALFVVAVATISLCIVRCREVLALSNPCSSSLFLLRLFFDSFCFFRGEKIFKRLIWNSFFLNYFFSYCFGRLRFLRYHRRHWLNLIVNVLFRVKGKHIWRQFRNYSDETAALFHTRHSRHPHRHICKRGLANILDHLLRHLAWLKHSVETW